MLGRLGRSTIPIGRAAWAAALLLPLLALVAALLLPLLASAQQSSKPAAGSTSGAAAEEDDTEQTGSRKFKPRSTIEEIVILGETLEQQNMDEASAITSFSAEDLKALRVQNISDLADFTPNLEINTRSAASNPTLFIRGIGLKDYNANAASAVSVYQDGVNINAPAIQLGQLFDLEDVEVRRGPQGSLQGRNATAGAIMLRSRLPSDEFGASGSFTYGKYNDTEIEGAMDIPLVEDTLFSRVAFTVNLRDGITKNACSNWNPTNFAQFQDAPGSNRLVDSYIQTEQTLRQEYELDKAANNAANLGGERYVFSNTRRNNRQALIERAGIDAQAKRLNFDGICILKDSGFIVTERGATPELPEGTFVSERFPTLDTFKGLDSHLNNIDNWATRGILRYLPDDQMEWIFNVHGLQSRGGSTHLTQLGARPKPEVLGFFESTAANFSEAKAARTLGLEGVQDVNGLDQSNDQQIGQGGDDPFLGYYNRDGLEKLDSYGGNLTGNIELDAVNVLSISGYEWYDRAIDDEGDATPFDIFPAEWSDSAWQASQELTFKIEDDAVTWSFGGFLLYEQLTAFNLFPDTIDFTLNQNFDQKLLSLAPYASAFWTVTETVRLELGVRYNFERKEFTLGSTAVGNESNVAATVIEEQTVNKTWTAPTGDVTLLYSPVWSWLDATPVDVLNTYAKYARGFKGGHFNAGLSIRQGVAAQSIDPVEPEHIHALEIGLKTSLWDNAFNVRIAGFRYWYEDLQVFDIQNEAGQIPVQQLLNAPRARVWGAEVEAQTRPLEGLMIQGSFGWLDSRFVEFGVTKTVSLGPRGEPNQEFFDFAGNRTIASPAYSISGLASYEIPLFGWGFLIPQYDFNWRSKTYLDPQQLDPISQEAFWLHNARLSYRSENEQLELAFWVSNIADKYYKDDVFDLSREFNTILEVYGDPRTYGVTLSLGW
jgi:outer membrane receptor protein involved in Fe transport